jgi:hypothetical protein
MLGCGGLASLAVSAAGQPVPPPEPDAQNESAAEAADTRADESAAPGNPLSVRQQQVRARFAELEKLLLRMAELTAPTDPARAALLRQAVAQSKQRDIDHQFEELVRLLGEERLSLAVKGQGDVQRDLARLLELLLSEDRTKRIESEKERVREYLKQVNKIIKEQKSVQDETSRGRDAKPLADRQGELADKTGELAQRLGEDAREKQAGDESADGQQPRQDEPGDAEKPDEEKRQRDAGDADKDPQDKNKNDDKRDADDKDAKKDGADEKDAKDAGQPADQQDAEPGPSPAEGKEGRPQQQPPMPGEPNEGQSQPGQQPPSESPAQQRLEQAQRRMREAQEKLEQAKREDATQKQAEALKELQQAKAELEEILRQLREEEMSRMLAMLEGRFRKMLDAQVEVYEGTQRVDQVPQTQRDRDDEIEAGRLSRKEAQIVVEADKCLGVLREEGTAVAFPEAVVEMRDDMQQVVERLARTDVGQLTQGIETDIIAALEEMIAALKKAQKEMEDKQQQAAQGQVVEGDPPLVDVLAELKMIRALQMRVNKRTQRYAEMTKNEQADQPELLEALRQLAEREERIHKVTRDIVVGRNR